MAMHRDDVDAIKAPNHSVSGRSAAAITPTMVSMDVSIVVAVITVMIAAD